MRGLLTAVPVVLAAAAVAVLAVPAPAAAHSALVSAAPGPGDDAAPGVRVVALTFVPLRDGGGHRVTVTGPDDQPVATAAPVLVGRATLCVAVDPLTRPGAYAVSYEIVAADGDRQQSRFYFQVSPGGSPVATPPACRRELPPVPAAGATPPPGGPLHTVLAWITVATIAVMAAMLAAGFAVHRRATTG